MSHSLKRLQKEFNDLIKIDPENITAKMLEDNYIWELTLKGPKDTPYEGGTFYFEVKFPYDYPFKPFKLILTTKIYHPQFVKMGDYTSQICCCVTRTGMDSWSPAMTLPKILKENILPYFSYPDFNNNCMDREYFGKKFDDDFIKIAKEWTLKYAM